MNLLAITPRVMLLGIILSLSACCSLSDETRIGEQVVAVQHAIKHPEDPKSMEAIIELGTDSRYYVMTRGWLVQELQGVASQRDARQHESSEDLAELDAKIAFLKKAIRRIDLE